MFLLLVALQGCALDESEPAMSSDELASTGYVMQRGLEIEGGSISGSLHRG